MGVLLFSLDLDEILQVADQVAVLFGGRVVAVTGRSDADREVIGRLMTTGEVG
jgi:simple sugar transport system ATP-binding protein